eukprot:TRINITY_DN2991_c0_g2_i1.p1 TRINITY_DN2991_c0_g2~~TRINITY_DN2991_c0_g2_i1.p1  ORF type:complete len:606 (+),score=146.90 TRINITY_DN2991_c0_g2_i1:116-1819(+)
MLSLRRAAALGASAAAAVALASAAFLPPSWRGAAVRDDGGAEGSSPPATPTPATSTPPSRVDADTDGSSGTEGGADEQRGEAAGAGTGTRAEPFGCRPPPFVRQKKRPQRRGRPGITSCGGSVPPAIAEQGAVAPAYDCLHTLRNVCVGGPAHAFVVAPQPPAPGCPLLCGCNEDTLPYALPVVPGERVRSISGGWRLRYRLSNASGARWEDAPVDDRRAVWLGKVGAGFHLAHFLRFTLTPLALVVLDTLKGADVDLWGMLCMKCHGARDLITQLGSMFGRTRFLDDAARYSVRCYGEGAWGIPRMPEHIPRGASPWGGAQRRPTHFYWTWLRGRLWALAGLSAEPGAPREPGRRPRAALIQRAPGKGKAGRNIANAARLLAVGAELGVEVRTVEWSALGPLARQVAAVRSYDVLFGVHGNNNWALSALEPGSVLVELCPQGCQMQSGVNVNDGQYALRTGMGFFAYQARMLNVTHIGWTAGKAESIYDPQVVQGHPMFQRCFGNIGRRWKSWWLCADVAPAPGSFRCLLSLALARVRAFDGAEQWLPADCHAPAANTASPPPRAS